MQSIGRLPCLYVKQELMSALTTGDGGDDGEDGDDNNDDDEDVDVDDALCIFES